MSKGSYPEGRDFVSGLAFGKPCASAKASGDTRMAAEGFLFWFLVPFSDQVKDGLPYILLLHFPFFIRHLFIPAVCYVKSLSGARVKQQSQPGFK
jgi:hypothetical protein